MSCDREVAGDLIRKSDRVQELSTLMCFIDDGLERNLSHTHGRRTVRGIEQGSK